mmetsp:Transcript_12173/g.36678  ORF Transcript_12173/g.36678 Transcript_12173/m.36678 type:complete len:207 (+) Transcript_12173:363-983(+)
MDPMSSDRISLGEYRQESSAESLHTVSITSPLVSLSLDSTSMNPFSSSKRRSAAVPPSCLYSPTVPAKWHVELQSPSPFLTASVEICLSPLTLSDPWIQCHSSCRISRKNLLRPSGFHLIRSWSDSLCTRGPSLQFYLGISSQTMRAKLKSISYRPRLPPFDNSFQIFGTARSRSYLDRRGFPLHISLALWTGRIWRCLICIYTAP